ncbi:hypothetical protein PAXINDRAFT_86682 [Paxillus involutus ATCC 200175]|uniref:Uncharacterized protein n=1 Tax=Paxillus involutus ATCC 200175 TaxID=664439 RepID=A0A0C9TQE4_PAXIN|nr:hypothetical protein PAXINDRAFT_86682 [Paxillus involutus ATCC 200175]
MRRRASVVSPDGRLIANNDNKGTVIIREISDEGEQKIKISIETNIAMSHDGICFIPNAEKIACAMAGGIQIFDIESGEPSLPPMKYPEPFVGRIVGSRVGSQLFSGSCEGTILRWDTETGEPIGQP